VSWTYTDNPQSCPRDALRFKVGDTNEEDPLLTDAQCDFLLNDYSGDILQAAIEACRSLAAKFAAAKPCSVGEMENPPTERAKVFLTLADSLRAEAEAEEDEEEEESVEESQPSPGYSSAALNRKPLFTRGVGYGTGNE